MDCGSADCIGDWRSFIPKQIRSSSGTIIKSLVYRSYIFSENNILKVIKNCRHLEFFLQVIYCCLTFQRIYFSNFDRWRRRRRRRRRRRLECFLGFYPQVLNSFATDSRRFVVASLDIHVAQWPLTSLNTSTCLQAATDWANFSGEKE